MSSAISIGPVSKQNVVRKNVIIFLSISLNVCLDAQKNRLIVTILLSTHNICFGWGIRKNNFQIGQLLEKWAAFFRNNVSIFQEHTKTTHIQVNILPFSLILTNYHHQNNSIYVKNQLSRIIGGT